MKTTCTVILAALLLALAGCAGDDLNEESAQQLLPPGSGGANPIAGPGAVPVPYAPLSLPSPTVISPTLGDDAFSAPIDIGFTFVFFGNPYTQLLISSNGFLDFNLGDINSGCCGNYPIPSPDTWNNIIAFYWTDLDPPNVGAGEAVPGSILYQTVGAAPNRRFVVDFDRIGTNSFTGIYDGQIVLYEGTNTIEIHTTRTVLGSESPYTQGVEDPSGTVAYFLPGRVLGTADLINDTVRFGTN